MKNLEDVTRILAGVYCASIFVFANNIDLASTDVKSISSQIAPRIRKTNVFVVTRSMQLNETVLEAMISKLDLDLYIVSVRQGEDQVLNR